MGTERLDTMGPAQVLGEGLQGAPGTRPAGNGLPSLMTTCTRRLAAGRTPATSSGAGAALLMGRTAHDLLKRLCLCFQQNPRRLATSHSLCFCPKPSTCATVCTGGPSPTR